MKNPESLLVAILIATAVIGSIPHVSSSILDLTVFTSNPSYIVTDDITIFGDLAYDSSPVPNWPVAIEVQDPIGTLVLTRTPQTNASGTYALTFKLPTNAKRGPYTVYASASYKGEGTTDNTSFELLVHDVSLSGVTAARIIIYQNYSCAIAVTAANGGDFAETFNITAYANTTVIGTLLNLTLASGNSTTVTFTWNTTGFAYGNYTLSACAQPIPGETNTANNNCTGDTIKLTIPGDINGDFKVTLSDLVLLANAYGSTPQMPSKWNPNADFDNNGTVGLTDLVILAIHCGQHYP